MPPMTQRPLTICLLLLGVACSGKSSPPAHNPADTAALTSTVPPPEHMKLKGRAMLPAFRSRMDSMAAHPSMMRSDMARHRADVKHVVDAMHSDMMALHMPSDPAYEALADSVVQGSARLGTAGGA